MNSIKEHSLQKIISKLLKCYGVFHIQTDVMDGLKFCATQKSRLAFINHHKAMGYEKGQADMILILPNRVVFAEIKNGKIGKQSEEQKRFQRKVEALGHEYVVWRTIQDCELFLKNNQKSLRNG